MAAIDGELSERVQYLERQVEQLAARINAEVSVGSPSRRKQTRTARTVESGGSYPSSGNTFPIIFVDGEYTETAGNQTPTYTARAATPSHFVHNVADQYISVNIEVQVWFENEQWWCEHTTEAANEREEIAGNMMAGAYTVKSGTTNIVARKKTLPEFSIDSADDKLKSLGQNIDVYNLSPFVQTGGDVVVLTTNNQRVRVPLTDVMRWQYQEWMDTDGLILTDGQTRMATIDDYYFRDTAVESSNVFWSMAKNASLWLMHHFDVLWTLEAQVRWHSWTRDSATTQGADGHAHDFDRGTNPLASVQFGITRDWDGSDLSSGIVGVSEMLNCYGGTTIDGRFMGTLLPGYAEYSTTYNINHVKSISSWGKLTNTKRIDITSDIMTRLDVIVRCVIHGVNTAAQIAIPRIRLGIKPIFPSVNESDRWWFKPYSGPASAFQWWGAAPAEPGFFDRNGEVTVPPPEVVDSHIIDGPPE
jgi:hypothetical protein